MEDGRETAPPGAVELHLHHGPGVAYGVVGAILLMLGGVIPASNLQEGRLVAALLCAVILLVIGVGLARIALSMLRTRLTADDVGLRGRTPEGSAIDEGWQALSIDGRAGTLLLEMNGETVRLNKEGWVGFMSFVLLLHRTPAASASLTPAAQRVVLQLLLDPSPKDPDDDLPF